MAINSYALRIKPVAGQTVPIDMVSGASLFGTGPGTVTLVDTGGGVLAWRFAGGSVSGALPTTWNVNTGLASGDPGLTMAMRVRISTNGFGVSFLCMGKIGADATQYEGLGFLRSSDSGLVPTWQTHSMPTVLGPSLLSESTYVARLTVNDPAAGANEETFSGWKKTSGRVGSTPDSVLAPGVRVGLVANTIAVLANGGYVIDVLEWIVWRGQLTDVEAASVADDITAALAPDTTPPVLSAATGTGGIATCSGGVTTDEAGGTLYGVVTASATKPTPAQVLAGQDAAGAAALRAISQAVSAVGAQTIASGSVTAGTRYWHFAQVDSSSNLGLVVSSASFTVTAAVTGPTITVQPTSQTVSAPAAASFSITATTSSGTISHQLQHQPSGGGGYSNVGSPSVVASGVGASVSTGATAISGGSNNNGDTYRFASTDGTGTNYSSVVTLTVTAPAATFTSEVLTRNNGSVAVSSALTWVRWYNPATGELVLSKGGISTNASGVFSTADTALSTGTTYALDWLEATGQRRMPTKAAT